MIGSRADYRHRHPTLGEILLVVEVAADAKALATDRRGLSRYAWAGIPVAWIVNLADETIEVYTEPSGPSAPAGYARRAVLGVDDALNLALDPATTVGPIAVADLLR